MEPSFSENEPEPALKSDWGIVFGFVLSLLLHLIQVVTLAISTHLPTKAQDAVFVAIVGFFGFIQLLYIVPAIFYFRKNDYDKVVIGLIIGASLTFILGLPLAGLFVYCASNKTYL